MHNRQLQEIKGDLFEIIQDNYCGATRDSYLLEVEGLFEYIKQIKLTSRRRGAIINQLKKGNNK